MPLPALNEDGFLPPGLHGAGLGEIENRFGCTNTVRQHLFERLCGFVRLARHVGAHRMFIGGSFVTAKPELGDVDVVVWVGSRFLTLLDDEDEEALDLELQFLTREPREAFAVFDAEGWESWTEFFASVRGRREVRGGLVEVIL